MYLQNVSVQLAIKFRILLVFQNLQEVNKIFKMAASDGLFEVRILNFGTFLFYIRCDWVCDSLHGLIWVSTSVLLDFNIAEILYKCNAIKPVLSSPQKRRPKFVIKTDYRLMQVKRIAECSKRAFCNTFDLH